VSRLRLSTDDLGLFFEPHHHALAARLRGAAGAFAHEDGGSALDHARKAVAALAASGLLPLLLPDAATGRTDVRALCLCRELLGQVSPLADAIFAVQGLGTQPLALAGSPAQRALLADAGSGAAVFGFALTEPEAGSDVASLRTSARRDGDHFVLDGDKTFISNVGIATHLVVFANAEPAAGKKGISAFLVETGAAGLSTEPIPMTIDHPIGAVHLRGCRVPASALVGAIGQGLSLALGTLDTFRTSVGAAACGMAFRALDLTLDRVSTRQQFGKPLAEQQQVQAYLAEMATRLDAARLLTLRAAHAKDTANSGAAGERGAQASAVAMAKLYATEAAQQIIDLAVQLHGGLGVTLGSEVERLLREIRPLRIYEGTTEIQRVIIAREILSRRGGL